MTWPRSVGSRLYLAQLAAVAVGVGLIPLGYWRFGVALIGVVFLASCAARVLVPAEHLGMLQVRGKLFDVAWMFLLAASLIVLAFAVPPQPG